MTEESGNPEATAVAESPAQGTSPTTPSSGTEQAPETPFFFQKSEKAKVEEAHGIDPSKLPPELQPLYKSMQADYTRKTQEVAELRKSFEAQRQAQDQSQQMFKEYLDRTLSARQEAPNPQANVAQTIRDLQEQGRYDEANALLVQQVQSEMKAQIDPLKQQAEIANRTATFRDIVSDLKESNPVVKTYGQEIAQVFESPGMEKFRVAILSNAQTMRDFLPMALDLIGSRIHAARLEKDFPTMVDREVTKRLTAERSKAMGVPSRLVESGSQSRPSGQARMTMDAAINNAIEALTGG